jgi:4-amino-4-deoxy-L-arabinose transferase-like glycosyltransferase
MSTASNAPGELSLAPDERRTLLWIMLGALVLRLVWWRFDTFIAPDGFYYAELATALASGDLAGALSPYWPPLYPALMGLLSVVVRDVEIAGRLVSLLSGVAILVPSYLLARNLLDRRIATVAVVLLALHPMLVAASTKLLSDMLYVAMLVTAILLGMHAAFDDRPRRALWPGLLCGACYLTRPEGFGYVWLYLLLVPVVAWVRRAVDWRALATSLGLMLGGFLLLAVPYVVYVHSATGVWTISSKLNIHVLAGKENWYRLIDGEDLTHADKIFAGKRSERREEPELARRPGERPNVSGLGGIASSFVRKLLREYRAVLPDVFPPVVMVLLGVGIFTRRRREDQPLRELYVLAFSVATLLGYAFTIVEPRYLLGLVPLFYAWVAAGIVALWGRLGRDVGSPRIRWVERLVLPVLLAIMAFIWIQDLTYLHRRQHYRIGEETKKAARFMRDRGPDEPLVMVPSPDFAFYAGTDRFWYLPDEPVETVLDYARRRDVDYIVIDDKRGYWREGLRDLLEVENVPAGLELVYRSDEVRNGRVRVYVPVDASAAGR